MFLPKVDAPYSESKSYFYKRLRLLTNWLRSLSTDTTVSLALHLFVGAVVRAIKRLFG